MLLPSPHNSQDWLRQEFSARQAKNRRYSQRAFARHLEIPSGRLSELLSGKRRLTASLARRLGMKLAYPPEKIEALVQLTEK